MAGALAKAAENVSFLVPRWTSGSPKKPRSTPAVTSFKYGSLFLSTLRCNDAVRLFNDLKSFHQANFSHGRWGCFPRPSVRVLISIRYEVVGAVGIEIASPTSKSHWRKALPAALHSNC